MSSSSSEAISETLGVSFGPSLSAPAHAVLRGRLKALATGSLTRPMHVDTLFGIYNTLRDGDLESYGADWFLVFDLHRAFFYQDPMTSGSPGIDSIVRFVVDDYPWRPFPLFADHFLTEPFLFFYDLASLDILPDLFRNERPGKVMILDFRTAEIRTGVAHVHPEARMESSDSTPNEQILRLEIRPTGADWRTPGILPLDDLVSPDVGIIRQEHLVVPLTVLASSCTRVGWVHGTDEAFCGAQNFRPTTAQHVGRCEAVERFQVIFQRPDDLTVYGSYSAFRDHAVDPASLFYGKTPAGRTNTLAIYSESTPMYWTWADRVTQGRRYLVPAQDIWFSTRQLPRENMFIRPTTNGCALGRSLEEASLFALLEAIERDAYLTMWYLRRTCSRIAPASVDCEPFQMLWATLESSYPEYDIHLVNITTDIQIPAVAAVAERRDGEGPRTLHAAAASPFCQQALFSALKDISASLAAIQDRGQSQMAKARELLANPTAILTSQDHKSIYALDEALERTFFLRVGTGLTLTPRELDQSSIIQQRDTYDILETVNKTAMHLEELGLPVLLKDITHPAFARRQLFCVKALVPGLAPMWYGHNYIRLNLTERLCRLARALTGQIVRTVEDLNLDVHPFG